VKVILTVRDNTVDVTLAAGSRAREALRDGSPQLRALLELTGATTGHVVIRDLSSGAVSFATASNAATSGGQQHPSGNGSGHPTHQGAPDDAASGGGPGGGQAGAWGDGSGTGPDRSSHTGVRGVRGVRGVPGGPRGPAGPHAGAGAPAPPPVGNRSPSSLDLDL
jgi:hypothetical protein